jgi:site-specific recombinase XerD
VVSIGDCGSPDRSSIPLKGPLILFRDPIHEKWEFFFSLLIFRRVIDSMHDDIYNSAGRLEQRKKSIAVFKNGRCAVEFLDKMILMGLSPIRVASIAFHVTSILRIKDDAELRDWTKEDVETIVREFQKKDWKSETRERFIFVLKRFVSYAKQGIIVEKRNDQDYSPEVTWLHPKKYRIKNDDSTLENRKGFSESEILQLLSVIHEVSINYERDYLFIIVGYEAGLRVAELMLLKLKDVEIDGKNNIAYIIVKSGKGSARKIPLILSLRKLIDFIANHPLKANPEAYLFYSKHARDHRLSYKSASALIHRACEKAGLPRRNLYKLRHSRITNLLLSRTPMPIVQKISGHKRLETVRIYTSIINADVVDAVMIDRGLKPEKKNEDEKIQVKKCIKCNRMEDPTAVCCSNCGSFLDITTALKFRQARESYSHKNDKKTRKEIEELRDMVLQQQKTIQEFISNQQKN